MLRRPSNFAHAYPHPTWRDQELKPKEFSSWLVFTAFGFYTFIIACFSLLKVTAFFPSFTTQPTFFALLA
jgi:hypothetical protein